MRLLDTKTGMFVEKNPIEMTFAILSHTWDIKGEQTYQDLRKIQERYALKDQPRSGAPRNGSCSSPPLSELEPPPIPSPSSYPSSKQKHKVPLSPTDIDSTLSILHVCPKTSHDYTIIPVPTRRTLWEDPELSPKIRQACKVARSNGFRYIWIDSCCIDKSSSSELSEAINSMYSWYMRANVCYAYLVDVPAGVDHRNMASLFRKSRWFRRGWTLQELIAPPNVMFVSEDWTIIGTKWAFADLVQEITGISVEALLQLESLDRFGVAQRLSWASGRETTRVEDQAYSLLGLFDINMSTLYGEGSRAFRRLQEEIMRRIPDQSLFAWGEVYLGSPMLPTEASTTGAGKKPLNAAVAESMPSQRSFSLRSLKLVMPSSPLAEAPSYFSNCRSIDIASLGSTSHIVIRGTQLKYSFSPYGIRTQFPMIPLSLLFPKDEPQNGVQDMSHCQWYVAILGCEHAERPGYLLGRVCCTLPCHSGVELLSCASAPIEWMKANFEVIPLSPEAIEHCRPHIEQKTVYISHPNRDDPLTELGANCDQPHQNINLLAEEDLHRSTFARIHHG